MSIHIIGIATAASVSGVNAVLEAMGRGPGSLTRKASTDPVAAWDDTPTHWFMSDQGVTAEFQTTLLGFSNGDLPPLPDGVAWGVNGVIGEAEALEAVSAENFAFASFNDGFTPGEQVAAALGAMGLTVLPDPPL